MNKIPPKPNDKRTKNYKQWVAKYEKQSSGVGDTVEKITKATGIKAAVDGVFDALGKDCGCNKRKETLNKMFPYNKPNCLTLEEHSFLTEFYDANKTKVTSEEQRDILTIYNRVFNYNDKMTSCGSCFAGKLSKLKSLFDEYSG